MTKSKTLKHITDLIKIEKDIIDQANEAVQKTEGNAGIVSCFTDVMQCASYQIQSLENLKYRIENYDKERIEAEKIFECRTCSEEFIFDKEEGD